MATTKKATKKKTVHKRVKVAKLESFKLCREPAPFVTFRFTDQTLYWSVLLILILALSLWVLQIQINISDVLSQITPV